MKIDWRRKLTSRKFWAMVGIMVTNVLVLANVDAETTTQIVSIIASAGAVITYILSEAKVDAAKKEE